MFSKISKAEQDEEMYLFPIKRKTVIAAIIAKR